MVYDITLYIDYHPGGVDELMQGAGIDSTDLFNEVHKWVNFQNMLKECFIGYLVGLPKAKTLDVPGGLGQFKAPPLKKTSISFSNDKYQTKRCYTFIIYCKLSSHYKYKQCFYCGETSDYGITVSVQCLNRSIFLSFKYAGVVSKTVLRHYPLKLEIQMHKANELMWDFEGEHHKESKTLSNSSKIFDFPVKLISKIKHTHDVNLLEFQYEGCFEGIPPFGAHIFIKNPDKSSVVTEKPYTIFQVLDSESFKLLVKTYKHGILSSYISKLSVGDVVLASGFHHYFDLNVVEKYRNLVILAAGTGITPFYRIITEVLNNVVFADTKTFLFFYNKTYADTLIKSDLEELYKQFPERLVVTHVFSQEDAAPIKGYIEENHLKEVPADALFLTCGPLPFMKQAMDVLKRLNVESRNIIEFKG